MSTLFISHSSRDNASAEEVRDRLAAQGHGSVFLDLDPEKGIQAGTSWERTLYAKLRACRAVVALCTENYLASQWCFAEIALARMEGKEIFALQMDPWSEATELPSILTERQFIDLREKPEEGYERLWNGFNAFGITPADHREWNPAQPPYPGLRAFTEKDTPVFFGRDAEIQSAVELLNRVRRQGHPRLVAVLGSSGSGKSSLTRAGIVPRLRRDVDNWRIVGPFRPGRHPIRQLAAAFARAFDDAGVPQRWEDLYRKLRPASSGGPTPEPPPDEDHEEPRERLLEALESVEGDLTATDQSVIMSISRLRRHLDEKARAEKQAGAPTPTIVFDDHPVADLASKLRFVGGATEARTLLVIDQFEELLGHDDEGPEHPANRFLDLLKEGLEVEDSPVMALITMRSDFLGMLQRASHFTGVGFKSWSVGPMSKEGMHEVIAGPAHLGAIELDSGGRGEKSLVERLLDDTGTPDALPLLAFTLRVMWEKFIDLEGGERTLRNRDYDRLGGLQGAIARVADETLEAAVASGGSERELQLAFLGLARPASEGTGWTRQAVEWDAFPDSVHPLLQRFVDQRLLIRRADGAVEVAHEALFRSWRKLRGWLEANAEGLHLLREIRDEATKWEAEETPEEREAYLWRSTRLARALELRDHGVLALGEVDRAFLDASDKAERARAQLEESRRKRAFRWTLGGALGATALAILAILAAIDAHKERIRAVNEEVRALALDSIHLYQAGQPFYALLEAVETSHKLLEIDEDDRAAGLRRQVEAALFQSLSGVRLKNAWRAHDAWPNALVAGRDGSWLASAGYDKSVRRWLPDGEPCGRRLTGHGSPILALAVSPGGTLLVSGDQRGYVRVWPIAACDSSEPERDPLQLEAHDQPVRALAFHPHLELFASGGNDGRIRFWATDGSLLHELQTPRGVASLAFEPDGRTLVSGEACLSDDDGCGSLTWWAPSDATVTPDSSWTPARTLPAHQGTVHALTYSRDGRHLASGGADAAIKEWAIDGSLAAEHLGSAPIYALGYDRHGTLFSAGVDRRLRKWRHDGRNFEVDAHEEPITGLALVDSDTLVATVSQDLRIKLWNLESSGLRVKMQGHRGPVQEVDVSPDGELIASGGDDRTVRLWSRDGVLIRTVEDAHESIVRSVRFDSGRALASAGHDGFVRLWPLPEDSSTAAGEPPAPLRELLANTKIGVNEVDFGAEGMLTAGLDGATLLWPADGEPRNLTPEENQIWGARLSPNGKVAVSILSEPPKVRVLTLDDSAEQFDLAAQGDCGHTQPVVRTAFSPDGGRIATVAPAGNAVLWAGDGSCVAVLTGHGRGANSVDFSSDGRWLVTAGLDGGVRLWDAETGQLQRTLLGHRAGVNSVTFGPGGSLVSAGADYEINIWHDVGVDLDELMKRGAEWIADYRRLHGDTIFK